MSLRAAVDRHLIDGQSVTIVDPTSGQRLTLEQAVHSDVMQADTCAVVNPKTGESVLLSVSASMELRHLLTSPSLDFHEYVTLLYRDVMNRLFAGEKILSFTQAVRSGLLESRVKTTSAEVVDQQTGDRRSLALALQQDVIESRRVTVYDPQRARRVSLDAAIRSGLIDPDTLHYLDPDSGLRHSAVDAVNSGLVAIAGAPIMATSGLAHGVQRTIHTEFIRSVEVEKGKYNKQYFLHWYM